MIAATSKQLGTQWLRGAVCALALGVGVTAQAATVTFSDVVSANGVFNGVQIEDTLDLLNGSTFAADSQGSAVVFDTIAFVVTANPGYYITGIKFDESGSGFADSASFAGATATWVVNGTPSSLGYYVFPQGSSATFSLGANKPVPNANSLVVSITNNLFAVGPDANVLKNSALVTVTTAPIPEPSSVLWLLAGLGLVAVVRRRFA